MLAGYRPSPALQYPSFGSVSSHEFGPRDNLPPYVCIPNQPNEFAGSGYLSSAYSGFSLGADPADGRFKVCDLNLPEGIDGPRFDKRRRMLDVVKKSFKAVIHVPESCPAGEQIVQVRTASGISDYRSF